MRFRIVCGLVLGAMASPAFAAQPAADAKVVVAGLAPPGVSYRWVDEGPVFVDQNGMTLYVRAKGKPCPDVRQPPPADAHPLVKIYFTHPIPSCADQWPSMIAGNDAKPVGDWTIVTNVNGERQWAFQGAAVHRSYKDFLPGDANGFGRIATNIGDASRGGEFDFASPKILAPPVIAPIFRPGFGLSVQGVDGKALYIFKDDRKSRAARLSLPQNLKQEKWKPVQAGTMAAPIGKWTIASAPSGMKIWAYDGAPVFTYVDDYEPIDVNGVGLEGAELILLHPVEDAPRGIFVSRTIQGPTFVDANGMTTYDFHCYLRANGAEGLAQERYACDSWDNDPMHAEQFCTAPDKCAANWRPVLAAVDAKARGGSWSTAVIPDPERYPLRWRPFKPGDELEKGAVKAVTYRGRVLYTSTYDKVPGDHWGSVNNGYHAGQSWWPVLAGMRDEGR